MRRSVHFHLVLIFLGFLLAVAGSVTVTFRLIQTQQDDATVINLAGRQRMLTQQMTRLALTQPLNPDLNQAVEQFGRTLNALTEGGEVRDTNGRLLALPATTDTAIQSELDEITQAWHAFQEQLQPPITSSTLESQAADLLIRLDNVVTAYEVQAQAKITRLQQVQLVFLLAAILLLGWGYVTTRRRIIQPLSTLGKAAQNIGQGNLSLPLPALRDDELGQLAVTMEAMRKEIAASQELLERRVQQRTHELTAAFEFSQEIIQQLDLSRLLQSVAHRAQELMQAEAASVCLLKSDGRILELVANSSPTDQFLGLRQSTQQGIALPVIQEGQTVSHDGGCANCGFLHHFPGDPCLAAPLKIGEQTLGALCVVRPRQIFDEDESRALTLLANAAAIAIDNAQLVAAAQQQTETNAALMERERLAADLHDNLAQTLAAINLKVDTTESLMSAGQHRSAQNQLQAMQTAVKTAYTQVRMALIGLREPTADEDEFVQKLQACLETFQAKTGVPAKLSVDDPAVFSLPPVTQKQALYIVREALTNISRHAQADQVEVIGRLVDGSAQFKVIDNGCGFEQNHTSGDHHLGLTIMQTRAARSGGHLAIQSVLGQGTQITATFPLKTPNGS